MMRIAFKSPESILILILSLQLFMAVLFFIGVIDNLIDDFLYLFSRCGDLFSIDNELIHDAKFIYGFFWLVFYFLFFTITVSSIIFLINSKFIGIKLSLISFALSFVPVLEILVPLVISFVLYPSGWWQITLVYIAVLVLTLLVLIFAMVKTIFNTNMLRDYFQERKKL